MSDLLYCFAQVAPYLNDLTINDTAIYIIDKEKYVYVLPGKEVPLSIKEGDTVPPGTVVGECMEKSRRVRRKVPAEVLGVPYIACGVPIKENNEIIGAISFVTSIKQQERVLSLASDLSEGLTELFSSSRHIEEGAEKMVDVYEELSKLSETLNGYISETDHVLKVIENFAKQTNLLGLNASVEAARAGTAGKGFGVIANETRRLATNTSDSAKQIETIFDSIKVASNNQTVALDNINHIIMSQSEAVKKVHERIEKLKSSVDILVDDSQKLNN